MIERMNPIFGTDIRTFPFLVKLQADMSCASSIFFKVSLALSRLLEKASRISWRLWGSGREKFGTSMVSGTTAAAMLLGAEAMCRASYPREKDFGWGFHANLSFG